MHQTNPSLWRIAKTKKCTKAVGIHSIPYSSRKLSYSNSLALLCEGDLRGDLNNFHD